MDYLLSVRPQEDQSGNFTGRWIEPITYQQGKVTAVEKLVDELKRQGTTIDEYEFWSDSEADLALFEYVDKKGGRCCVVNARETLLRIASERGWHVTDSYTQAEYDFAAQLVAKALANRENAPRLLRKSK